MVVSIKSANETEAEISIERNIDKKTYYEIRTVLIEIASFYQGRLSKVDNYILRFRFPSREQKESFIVEVDSIDQRAIKR